MCKNNVKDKSLVMAMVPNLEWDGSSFQRNPPSPQPRAEVTMTVMGDHAICGASNGALDTMGAILVRIRSVNTSLTTRACLHLQQ